MWVLGVGLLRDSGFMNSLATARHTAKVRGSYNIHSSCPQSFSYFRICLSVSCSRKQHLLSVRSIAGKPSRNTRL